MLLPLTHQRGMTITKVTAKLHLNFFKNKMEQKQNSGVKKGSTKNNENRFF